MLCTSTPAESPASSGVNISLITRHTGQWALADRWTIRSCSKKVISTLILFVVVTVVVESTISPSCGVQSAEKLLDNCAQVWKKTGNRSEIIRESGINTAKATCSTTI